MGATSNHRFMSRFWRCCAAMQSPLDYVTQMFADQLVHEWDILIGSSQQIDMDEELVLAATPIFEELLYRERDTAQNLDTLRGSEHLPPASHAIRVRLAWHLMTRASAGFRIVAAAQHLAVPTGPPAP